MSGEADTGQRLEDLDPALRRQLEAQVLAANTPTRSDDAGPARTIGHASVKTYMSRHAVRTNVVCGVCFWENFAYCTPVPALSISLFTTAFSCNIPEFA